MNINKLVKEYEKQAWDTWSIRLDAQEFEIIEDLPRDKDVRESKQVKRTKEGKEYSKEGFLIRVRAAGTDKDLFLSTMELRKIGTETKDLVNLKGCVFGFNQSGLTLVTGPTENMNENFNKPAASPQTPKEEHKALAVAMKLTSQLGTALTPHVVMQLASRVAPGHDMDVIMKAKEAGLIVIEKDLYRVVD